jgi:hypothetical protein
MLSLYPEAGDGGGCLSVARRPLPSGGRPNAERAAEEAARRARAKIRRYAAANRLNRLGTLTYRGEGCHDPLLLREHLAGFFRELRGELASGRLPYLWVPQWHPGGHGLHAHFAVGRFVPRRLIERAWGQGFVHIKLLDGLPVGSGSLAEARLAARYLARYVGRDLEEARRLAGLHRYEVAQLFGRHSFPRSALEGNDVSQPPRERIASATEPDERSRLSRARDALSSLGRQILAEIIAGQVTRGV